MTDPVARLHEDYQAEQAAAMERLHARQRGNRLKGAAAGAAGDLRRAAALSGNFMSLCIVVSCGAAVGRVIEE